MEFVNPSELWGHMMTPNYEEPEALADGTLYQVVRVQGKFSKKLPLYNYPYDRQVARGGVRGLGRATRAELRLRAGRRRAVTVNPILILPGYVIGTPQLVVAHRPSPHHLRRHALGHPLRTTRAAASRSPSRGPPLAYTAKLLLPVVCVMICAALMFLLTPAYVDARVDVGITALLTVVALQITSNQDLPDVGYLMLMDKVYLASYGFVMVGLAVVVRTARMVREQREAEATRIQRRSIAGLAAFYTLVLLALVVLAVQGG